MLTSPTKHIDVDSFKSIHFSDLLFNILTWRHNGTTEIKWDLSCLPLFDWQTENMKNVLLTIGQNVLFMKIDIE